MNEVAVSGPADANEVAVSGPASANEVAVSGPADARKTVVLGPADVGEVVALARARFAATGGLPHAAEPGFLRSRWAEPAFGVRDVTGGLVAAAAVRPGGVLHCVFGPGSPSPGALDRGLAEQATTVECESVTPDVDRLLTARGLRQVFAEDVLTVDPATVNGAPPSGATLVEWDAGTARRFFAVYEASFRDRPGFPGPTFEEWADDDLRPSWSLLAQVPGIGDAGFVTATDGWIDQVGVVPAARGRGLAGALVVEVLRRMQASGASRVWLTVNVDNPTARRVYERLGFTVAGRRARYRRAW